MFTLALAIGSAQTSTVGRMRKAAPTVKRWGGGILLGVGAWFVLLGLFARFFSDVLDI